MPDGLLLCELHAHGTWSDGSLTVRELVDLHRWSWPGYIEEIEREAERALGAFGPLVVPGVELTDYAADPDDSAHALAVELRRFVSVERGMRSSPGSRRRTSARGDR
jgi:hypothetical protein